MFYSIIRNKIPLIMFSIYILNKEKKYKAYELFIFTKLTLLFIALEFLILIIFNENINFYLPFNFNIIGFFEWSIFSYFCLDKLYSNTEDYFYSSVLTYLIIISGGFIYEFPFSKNINIFYNLGFSLIINTQIICIFLSIYLIRLNKYYFKKRLIIYFLIYLFTSILFYFYHPNIIGRFLTSFCNIFRKKIIWFIRIPTILLLYNVINSVNNDY